MFSAYENDDEEVIDDEVVSEELSLERCADAAKSCKSMQSFWKHYREEFRKAEENNWFIHICGHMQYERERLGVLEHCRCPFEVECQTKSITDRYMLNNSQHNCSKCKVKIGSICCGLADQYGISPMKPMECRDCDPEWAQKNIGRDHDAVVQRVPTIEEDLAPTQPVNNNSEEVPVNDISFSSQGSDIIFF